MMIAFKIFRLFGLLTLIVASWCGKTYGRDLRLPSVLETFGGTGVAYSNSGAAISTGIGSVYANPALMVVKRQYVLGGSYNWPVTGRHFYIGGVVDSVTSKMAAGLQYTGFLSNFEKSWQEKDQDSPIRSRTTLSVGYALARLALGGSLNYTKGFQRDGLGWEKVQGTSFGFGLAAPLGKGLMLGASAQHLRNETTKALSPRVVRVGMAYQISLLALQLEYRKRSKLNFIEGFENPEGIYLDEDEHRLATEQLMIFGSSLKIYDMVQLIFSYGKNLTGQKRQILSGGAALSNHGASLSYQLSRPYLTSTQLHHVVQLTGSLKL